jgi:hypothetical protein
VCLCGGIDHDTPVRRGELDERNWQLLTRAVANSYRSSAHVLEPTPGNSTECG